MTMAHYSLVKEEKPDLIIPHEDDFKWFEHLGVDEHAGSLSRVFNKAELTDKGLNILKNFLKLPNIDITNDVASEFHEALSEALLTHDIESTSLLSEEGQLRLPATLLDKIPSNVRSNLGLRIAKLYSFAFKIICNNQNEFHPWLENSLPELFPPHLTHETIRDYLMISVIQCIAGYAIKGLTPEDNKYPFFGGVIGKILTVENNQLKECRKTLNEFKQLSESLKNYSLLRYFSRDLYQKSEKTLTALLKEPGSFGKIPSITQGIKKASEIIETAKKIKTKEDAIHSRKLVKELVSISNKSPGRSKPLKTFFGALFAFAGIATIALAIAGIPFTGGLSLVGAITIGASVMTHIAGGAGIASGLLLYRNGKQRGYSHTLFSFAKQIANPESNPIFRPNSHHRALQ